MLKEELKVFDIDLDSIEPTHNFYEQVHKAIEEMQRNTLKDRFEVVLNDNLIKTKEIKTNYRTICGCRISYEELEEDVSFIVREDDKPTYEQLEKENKELKQCVKRNEYIINQIKEIFNDPKLHFEDGCDCIKTYEFLHEEE